MRVIPAILTNNTEDLSKQLLYISEFTDEVDIDIIDGKLIPATTIDIADIQVFSNLTYHFDLMVKEPINYINKILQLKHDKQLNLGRIFVNIEADYDITQLLKLSTENHFILGFSIPLASATESFLGIYNKILAIDPQYHVITQIYTVQIGKQGNPYHPEALAKIAQLRKGNFKGEIYLDGGIDPDILYTLKKADITGVSVGSYISHASDPMRAYNNLRDALWKQKMD